MNIHFNDCVRLRDLRELVDHAVKNYGSRPGFREINAERVVTDHSFTDLKSDSEALAAKLRSEGMKGRHIALLGETSYSYIVCYLATVNWVGVVVPIDKELTTEDIVHLLKKSDVEGLFFSDSFSPEISMILSECPEIRFAINMNPSENGGYYPSLDDFIASGHSLMADGYTEFLSEPLDADALCTILFTSGTTGANKGVMLCHRNLTACLFGAMSLFILPEKSFSVLPINHSYEFNIDVLGSIYGGAILCINDSIKHVKENLLEFSPQMSLMVPMIVEALHRNIWKEAEKAHLTGHLKYGIWYSNFLRKIGIDKRRFFFLPILKNLGGKITTIVCGGAPLNPALVRGFDDIGIHVYNGYGITECSPLISSNSPIYDLPGSVGIPVPGCQVRIGEISELGIGEILVKGENVMLGYYRDEEATASTFTEDGWFMTGDLGYMNKKGVLYITGRKKNLIILSNGKNVHPEELEEHLARNISYIQEVVVFAEKNSEGEDVIITASAYLDPQFTGEVGMDRARQIFESDVNRANKRIAVYKRIGQTMVEETEFEKTTTKKIRRNKVNKEGAKHA